MKEGEKREGGRFLGGLHVVSIYVSSLDWKDNEMDPIEWLMHATLLTASTQNIRIAVRSK